jgi:hypothetical protein
VAAYLLGYKKYWVFNQPFDTIPIDCSDALVHEPAPEPLTTDEAAAVAAIAAAIEGSRDAPDISPA